MRKSASWKPVGSVTPFSFEHLSHKFACVIFPSTIWVRKTLGFFVAHVAFHGGKRRRTGAGCANVFAVLWPARLTVASVTVSPTPAQRQAVDIEMRVHTRLKRCKGIVRDLPQRDPAIGACRRIGDVERERAPQADAVVWRDARVLFQHDVQKADRTMDRLRIEIGGNLNLNFGNRLALSVERVGDVNAVGRIDAGRSATPSVIWKRGSTLTLTSADPSSSSPGILSLKSSRRWKVQASGSNSSGN